MVWIAIAVGGALGASARHAFTAALPRTGVFPMAIFAVNAAGCLAIGLLAGLIAAGRLHVPEVARAFLIVGVLGGFTTFSSYALDTLTLARGGHPGLALINAGGQVIAGLFVVWLGFVAGSWRT